MIFYQYLMASAFLIGYVSSLGVSVVLEVCWQMWHVFLQQLNSLNENFKQYIWQKLIWKYTVLFVYLLNILC